MQTLVRTLLDLRRQGAEVGYHMTADGREVDFVATWLNPTALPQAKDKLPKKPAAFSRKVRAWRRVRVPFPARGSRTYFFSMGWHPFACCTLALALAGCGGESMHSFFTTQARPLIFAHRGGGGLLPEETLPALLSANASDPQAVVEFDVHGTADGHFVVFHDATLERTTDGAGPVSARTLAELQLLDAGYCATPGVGNGTADEGDCHDGDPARFPFRGQGYRIATLDEVFAALPPEAFVSVELKQPGKERELAEILRASGRMEHLIVGAEWDDVAVRLKDLLPELPHYYPTAAATCLALASKAGASYAACPHYEAFASPLSGAGLALDTRGVLDASHDDGVAGIYWTINDEPTMARLFLLGADGLYTDYPNRARRVLDELRAGGRLP